MKNNERIIGIICIIGILIYVMFAIYNLIIDPSDTYMVTQGTIAKEDEGVGYIIRDEKVVKGEDYENGIYEIASENQKVAVNQSIFRYYSDNEKEVTAKINELNYQIQGLLENEKNKPSSADIKAIEKQIEEKIQNINEVNNYQEVSENKKNIDSLISKKINFIGDVTENQEIKALINERNSYESQLKNGAEYQTAPIGGIVSYRVDGLEDKLSVDNFNLITEDYLEEIDLRTGQIIAASDNCGKVIDNFKCYIAVTMNSKESAEAKVGDKVTLRISNNEEYDAEIVQINEESGKRTIIFEMNKMTDALVKQRKIAIDVIWWSDSGLKVPNKAVTKEKGLNYVTRNTNGIQTKLLVKVVRQNDRFSIIEPYEDEELKEVGFSSSEIRNYKKISNYDELIINK